jgi:hypothetical protein
VVAVNEGPDVTGELQLRTIERFGADDSRYRQSVTLPAHSRKAYTFYVPPGVRVTPEYPRLELVAADRIIASTKVALQYINTEDRFYVTVGAESGGLSFLGDVEPAARGDARVVNVALAELPETPLAWESVDVLLLRDVDTTALSVEQRQALRTWLEHGGRLILGGGPGAATTLSGLADLAPVTVQGTTSLERLAGLQAYADVPVAEGPFAVATAALNDAGTLMISQQMSDDLLVLAARRDIGKGEVNFLAFDPELNPFVGPTARIDFWHRFLGEDLGIDTRPEFKQGYSLDDALSIIPNVRVLPVLQVIGFLLVYTVLVGPVTYVILRKIDRREWAWFTVPLLAVLFTFLAYLGGFQLRGINPIIHRLMVVNVPAGATAGRMSQAAGLFSPRRRTYTLQSESPYVAPLRVSGGGPTEETVTALRVAGRVALEDFRVDVGGLRAFAVEDYVPAPALVSDLHFSVESSGQVSVTGTLRNDSAQSWRDLVLVVGTQIRSLGDLEAGAELPVDLYLSISGLNSEITSFVDNIFEHSNWWAEPTLRRRHALLLSLARQNYATWNGPDFGRGIYLLAWSESNLPARIALSDRQATELMTGLYIYSLPAVMPGRLQSGEVFVPPALFDWQYETTAGHVELNPDGLMMYPESVVDLTFTPIPQFRLRQPERLTIQLTGGYSQTPPEMALWNFETAVWEPLEMEWGEIVIEDPVAYVSEQGEVHCRLSVGEGDRPFWSVPVPQLTLQGR